MPIIKTYLELLRVSNLPTVWSNVLTAVILSGAPFSWSYFLTLAFSFSLFYSAGMALNDICDARIDALQRPLRPLPSGRVSLVAANLLTVGLFASAFMLLLVLPHSSAALSAGALLLILIVFYDLFHKKNPATVLIMAGCRVMVYAVSGYALVGSLNKAVLTIALLQFAYIVFISLTARFENHRPVPFSYPVIPTMLAAICLVDGLYLAVVISPYWGAAGVAGLLLTRFGQRYVRGD